MSEVLFLRGHRYGFDYPRHNFLGVLSRFEHRRILVTDVRDLSERPLEAETFELQPLLNRGRYLVTGLDLDRNAERSFYVSSMRQPQELSAA